MHPEKTIAPFLLLLWFIYCCGRSGILLAPVIANPVGIQERTPDFSCCTIHCRAGNMSLLARLRASEAQKSQDAAGAQATDTSESLDPRAKMIKNIQAMFDDYSTCSVNGSGPPAGNGRDNLSLKLKREELAWGHTSATPALSHCPFPPLVP